MLISEYSKQEQCRYSVSISLIAVQNVNKAFVKLLRVERTFKLPPAIQYK